MNSVISVVLSFRADTVSNEDQMKPLIVRPIGQRLYDADKDLAHPLPLETFTRGTDAVTATVEAGEPKPLTIIRLRRRSLYGTLRIKSVVQIYDAKEHTIYTGPHYDMCIDNGSSFSAISNQLYLLDSNAHLRLKVDERPKSQTTSSYTLQERSKGTRNESVYRIRRRQDSS